MMTPQSFCYWLQGLLEIGNPKKLDKEQTQMIKDHLNLVFEHKISVELHDVNSYNGLLPPKAVDYVFSGNFQDWGTLSKEDYKNKYGYDPPASC